MGASLPENPGMAFAKVQHELANPWILAVYVIAMIAICWHFAYGVWLFAAKWGITPGETCAAALWLCLRRVRRGSCWHGTGEHLGVRGPKYQNAPDNVPLASQIQIAAVRRRCRAAFGALANATADD